MYFQYVLISIVNKGLRRDRVNVVPVVKILTQEWIRCLHNAEIMLPSRINNVRTKTLFSLLIILLGTEISRSQRVAFGITPDVLKVLKDLFESVNYQIPILLMKL